MDQATVIERVKEYAEVVTQHFDVTKIILYGSYARGTARKDSDIDVAVVLKNHLDANILQTETTLFRLRRGIDTRIEPILLDETHDDSGFLAEILKTGTVIFPASRR